VSALADIDLRCSFCGLPAARVAKLIAGPGVYICGDCVAICNDVLDADSSSAIATWEQKTDAELVDLMVQMAASRERVDESVGVAVRLLRERGFTWARVGEALGMTRQSAWERYSGEE
jgi:hypothetical protein